jgi:putative multiple sugar transport system permease protein
MKIPAFIVTLAGMMLFRGLTYFVTNINPISLKDNGYSYLATGTVDEVLKLNPIVDTGSFRLYPASLVMGVILVTLFIISEVIARNKKIANDLK